MRTILYCIFFSFLMVYPVLAQKEEKPTVSFKLKNEPISKGLREIEKQTGLSLSFESLLFEGFPDVTVNFKNTPYDKALDTLFNGTWVEWIRNGNFIILKRRFSVDMHNDSIRTKHLAEILVEADSVRTSYSMRNGGVSSIPASTLQRIPSLFGQTDVVRGLHLLPGVSSGSEGMTGLYVRGGNNDQNLFLLDNMPLYQISHLAGLFSPFNPDVIRKMDFYKSDFPSRYGGRLSSVVDIESKSGNNKRIHGSASLGLLSGSLYLEGPIIKDKLTFNIGIRRSWMDLITAPTFALINLYEKKKGDYSVDLLSFRYSFHDLNARMDYKINEKDKLSFHIYSGNDYFMFQNKDLMENWSSMVDYSRYQTSFGNLLAGVNWNRIINLKSNLSLGFSYTRYHSNITYKTGNNNNGYGNGAYYPWYGNSGYEHEIVPVFTEFNVYYPETSSSNKSLIQDFNLRGKINTDFNDRHSISYGANLTYHAYRPISLLNEQYAFLNGKTICEGKSQYVNKTNSIEGQIYIDDYFKLSDKLELNTGLRMELFAGKKVYPDIQPRIKLQYMANDKWNAYIAYSRMRQYIHMVPSSYFSLPNDVWFPTTEEIKPMTSNQLTAGVFYYPCKDYSFATEVYYKGMDNLLEFRNGAMQFEGLETWNDKLAVGSGRSYGIEWSARKETGKLNGWISYTLSWSDRLFPELNSGNRFPSRFDNRHKINIVGLWKISKKVELNAVWTYHSGDRVTLALDQYYMNQGADDWIYNQTNSWMPQFNWTYMGERNNVQLPAYHRLDLGLNIYRPKKNGRMGIWNISIYNAYCRMNVFAIKTTVDENHQTARASSLSFLPIIPMVSYTYKF